MLHTIVGNKAIMQEQLLALALHHGPPRVAIRVVPASAGVQAVFGGAFRLLQFAKHEPLVHLDVYVGGLFLEDADHVEAYQRLVPAIADVALSDAHSRELFASLETSTTGSEPAMTSL